MTDPRIEACERMAREFEAEQTHYRHADRFPCGVFAVLVGVSVATAIFVTTLVRALQ